MKNINKKSGDLLLFNAQMGNLSKEKEMTVINSNQNIARAKRFFLIAALAVCVLTGSAFAAAKNIEMQNAPASINANSNKTRNLYAIPNGTIGKIRLKFKWHAIETGVIGYGVPIKTKLKIALRHGSRTLATKNCYSKHWKSPPTCDINYKVDITEANRTGNWNIKTTNNSGHRAFGFDVRKGTDINPFVPQFKSTFIFSPCSAQYKTIRSVGSAKSIVSGDVQLMQLRGIGQYPGALAFKIKWHSRSRSPVDLKVKLTRPNGSVATTKTAKSAHLTSGPRMIFAHQVSVADAALSGRWTIQVQNNSGTNVTGFDVERGRGVTSSIRSTYKASCP